MNYFIIYFQCFSSWVFSTGYAYLICRVVAVEIALVGMVGGSCTAALAVVWTQHALIWAVPRGDGLCGH